MILRRLLNWLVADDTRHYTINNLVAIVIITLVCASSFDVLSPNMEAATHLVDMEVKDHAASTSSGNLVNQLFWVAMIGLAGYTILRDPQRAKRIVVAQWPLVIICLLAFASVTWALAPNIAFRRSVMLVFVIGSVFAGVSYLRRPEQLLLLLYRICTLALAFNLMALVLGNFDKDGFFYGIHGNKNVLGAIALLAILFGVASRKLFTTQINRFYNGVYLGLWLLLLLISVSKTSIALLFVVPALVFGVQVIATNTRLNVGMLMLLAFTLLTLVIYIVLSLYNWHIKEFFAQFMSDPGLTGRDYIWAFMLDRIDTRWLLGHGYGSFWGIGQQSPNVVYGRSYLTLLNQGHNGYLDLLAKLGVIGMAIYLLVLVQFARQSGQIQSTHPLLFFLFWILLVITLFHNITESSLMRGSHSMWIIQLLVLTSVARICADRRLQ
ncbi:O-antigen ligase family protein [Ferrimonas kyonanensis]|uniref:O-antigen ligase family protein n=1 Tax=Ferrimonas kyonanensis TaxID=364763 RepID=UPI000489C5DE|nr:O-antigen ligase family protein [Ferrimonas kyonanensis]